MILYDRISNVPWLYGGEMTASEMLASGRYRELFENACVLHEDGDGKIISYETLRSVCSRLAIPYTDNEAVDWMNVSHSVAGTYKAPGVEQAQQTADEAKAIAEQAGTDPQLAALATMQVATMDLTEATSTDCVGFRDYWPEWQPDTEYAYQQPLRHKGLYYRASKALTSSSVYPPDTAGESEYYPIEVAPDGVIVYRECHGQYDQVQAGETRHYPDAAGPVYRAKVDTAYDPDTVPDNWELVE